MTFWGMADSVWRMAYGKWRMADSVWRMAYGKWRMADSEWRMAYGDIPHAISYMLSAMRSLARYSRLAMCYVLLAICYLLIANSSANAFTAKSIGDYGNVTVMEVEGNYDAHNPDGSSNYQPRAEIIKEFLKTHKDEYDFLIIFSNFDFQMPTPNAQAFYAGVKNDIQGIGQRLFDNSSFYGSSGKLQGTVDMGNLLKMPDSFDPASDTTLSMLSHEIMHRWAAYIKYKDSNGNISNALLGADASHWSFLLDTSASLMYGNKWQDNGNGTFTSISARKYYSPLDLYLMGFLDKSQVPPMLLINNPQIDPAKMSEIGATISGTAQYITIDQIIAAEGERFPRVSESQKDFKSAFIFITSPGTFEGYEVYGLENIRNQWVTRHSILTDGKSLMQVALRPIGGIPINPGVVIPPVEPRTLPPNIEDGVKWLMANQGLNGMWMDLPLTADKDTAEAVLALKNFSIANENYSIGLQLLIGASFGNTDYLARKIEALKDSAQDITQLLNELVSRQNFDGGWGSNKGYKSNPVDTSFALNALALDGYVDANVIPNAIGYLKSKQNSDGGWGSDDQGSSIKATANALSAFNKYRSSYQLEDQIAKGIAWLVQKQNIDKGFGTSPSTVYDTAIAVLTLRELNVSTDITNKGIEYIFNLQSKDGSWYESPYQTAIAISAIWKATVDPDLSVKSSDITFIPDSVSSFPTNAVINANIWNLGRTAVPQAKVVLYAGSVSDANKIGEQVLAFPGLAATAVTFFVPLTKGSGNLFYVVVDPENLVKETSESNNTAGKSIGITPTYDLEVLSSDVSVSANPVDIFKDVKITSKITNKGTMNAYNVQVKYYIDEPGNPFDIATATVDIPANTTVTNEIVWRTNKAGENMPIVVFADPFDNFAELSEDNNKAGITLTVKGSTEPNLTISYKDIAVVPTPANQNGNVNISALVKNEGFSAANNIAVNFYKGDPKASGVLLGSLSIPSLNAGENRTLSLDWTNLSESGERIIYIKVDPDNQITEISKDDNDAFITLNILSLPDLAISTNSISFNPSAPKDGDKVSISVTIQNKGEQAVSNISVKAYEGSTLVDSQTVSSIAGNSQTTVSFVYDTAGKTGAHQITVVVDEANSIIEFSKENNTASRTFGVQNANLWVTEKYISPNGDGIKDSTQFFFRLDLAQTVKVLVINKNDETVRTFSGTEMENTNGSTITWDGLSDVGTVVDDGQYLMKIVDLKGKELGSLLVIVDTNRSSLTEAIGTKYLLNNNITCQLPDTWYWKWLPDESGIVFPIYSPNKNTPEYTPGLYTMAPDGQDINRLIPSEWTVGIDPVYDYYVQSHELSPDGEKVAFVLNKSIRISGRSQLSQLWVVDSDSKNLRLLVSYDLTQNPYANIYGIKWSPDSKYISYLGGNPTELWIVNTDTLEKTKIDPDGGYIEFPNGAWSPDSSKIAYFVSADNSSDQTVRISDLSGNRNEVFTMTRWRGDFEWLGNQQLVLSMEDANNSNLMTIWLVDATGNNKHIKIAEGLSNEMSYIKLSPDKKNFAFSGIDGDKAFVRTVDLSGNVTTVYEGSYVVIFGEAIMKVGLSDFIWSNDSEKLAFVHITYDYKDACPSYNPNMKLHIPYLIVVDKSGNNKKISRIVDEASCYGGCSYSEQSQCPYPNVQRFENINLFLDDNKHILLEFSDGYFAVNAETGEKQGQVPIEKDWYANIMMSPLGRYITYNRPVEPTSICYGRGYQDLWALSSLLNLTADLRAIKQRSSVTLKGIAADLNFEGYKIEYADTKTPNQWNLVTPPSDVPVINDVFTTWVPPYEGVFYVKLTVWDKAGNTATNRKRISWGLSSSITNIYKSSEFLSPNGDGIKDTFQLNYTVLEPVHLEFNIYNENNNLIRTFYKDYTSSGADYVLWDGKNEQDRIVPDGKYKIKIFDYEFLFILDNTPPEVGINISDPIQDVDCEEDCSKCTGTMLMNVFLNGHAIDNNLKNWIVEYGEGDNPQEWSQLTIGESQLGEKYGNENIRDYIIKLFKEEGIEFLVGKKIRITAEDFAGNKSTAITDFLKEEMIFYGQEWGNMNELQRERFSREPEWVFYDLKLKHRSYPILSASRCGWYYPDMLTMETHWLRVIETVRVPMVSFNMQYLTGSGWSNTPPVINMPSGKVPVEWNNSIQLKGQVHKLRVRGIDIFGQEHYSNEIQTLKEFELYSCAVTECPGSTIKGVNVVDEELKMLKLIVNGIDVIVYDAEKGDKIPTGEFCWPNMLLHQGDSVEMWGIGVNGQNHKADNNYSARCGEKAELLLDVVYKEEDCGMISNEAKLSARLSSESMYRSLKTLSYFIEQSGNKQLLRQIDLIKEPLSNRLPDITIDTSTMPEGAYPVTAVLDYESFLGENKKISGSNILIVDRILPDAQITYPEKGLMVCPVSQGGWFGIPIKGAATDNTAVNRYELYSGAGENPSEWTPAMTKKLDPKTHTIVDAPIVESGAKQGQLGIWNISDLHGSTYSLKLKVIDQVGNVSCTTESFDIDLLTEIVSITADKNVFSPNGDGVLDDVKISYQIDEPAIVDVKVFKAVKQADGAYKLDTTSVRTLSLGFQYISGEESVTWDGKDDSGAIVSDGIYGIAVFAKDSCTNANMKWIQVEVDNSPPTTIVTYPRPPDALGNIVEVKGTTEDIHFKNYTLEAGAGDNPDQWIIVSSGNNPVKDNILGKWNTFGLDGIWTLRLTAFDTVGNKNETRVTINLVARKTLIKDLSAIPSLFSPNNDAKLETSDIKYELTDACNVQIDIIDASSNIRKTYTTQTPSLGIYTSTWDGKDNAGTVVADGAYAVRLTASLISNTSVSQTEIVTVKVDATLPIIDIKQPQDKSYIKTDVVINGSITDANLSDYTITYTGPSGTNQIDAGNQNRENYTFGLLSELAEENYTLNVKAKDLAENANEKNRTFTIDRTPPKVTLDIPKEGEYYGSIKNIINITGSIVEKNLESYSLRYGLGDNPSASGGWTELLTGTTIPANPLLLAWKVGKNDGIPDGLYTLSLFAKDKAGLTSETKVKITIDNTAPEVSITTPKEGDYIKTETDITGTAFDLTLDKYTLEISEDQCSSAFKWAVIKTAAVSVKDGVLAKWQALPPDGNYCLRLTAIDKVENKSETKINLKVDTHPPLAPVLSGKVENKSSAKLTWTQNTEPDLAGYNIYKDKQKLNAAILKDISYLDPDLKEGVYTYTVTAFDLAGNESEPSNEVKLKIDLTGPDAKIRLPQDGSKVSDLVDIKGTAYSADDFKQYRIYIGQGAAPLTWNLIRTSPLPISYGTLAQWDTIGLSEGAQYSIKLEAEDISGNITTHQITVIIDNAPPAAPVLISAVPNVSDVTLTWVPNIESDLAGYLVYRNDQLANVAGIVIGDLKPYLVSGTTYLDKAVPDGKFRYYIIAMDQAGNISDQSNTIEVDIDTHPPKATIVDPLDKSKFEKKTLIKAESPDIDIKSIQFQYKKAQDSAWIDLGVAVTQMPYVTYIDPAALGLAYGDYNLRAIATDNGNKTDPTPSYITATYTDLTSPDAPIELKALTNGADVTLTWKANIETDISGYNIYRTSGTIKTKINSTLIQNAAYQDINLSDGTYIYEVTAVDTYNNESKPSNSVSAKIYAPLIKQPYTPVGQSKLTIAGEKAEASASVEIFADTGTNSELRGTADADSAGIFSVETTLVLGENKLTAKAKDSAGNISKASTMVVVVYNEPPAKPTGLAGSTESYNINLSWNPNTEADLFGYNLYRDNEKVNVPSALASGSVSASSYYSSTYAPAKAFDLNPATYWRAGNSYTFNPVWWQIDFATAELINHMEINWLDETSAGKNFEIQVWSGYAWITQTKVTGNNAKDNSFDFKPSYRTDKIRIYVTDSTDTNETYKKLSISEVKILKDNLISSTNYTDLNLQDGKYGYKVTAVDYYGFESEFSDETQAVVGDVVPPSSPINLTAAASGSDIVLNWTPNAEPDISGYNVYRNAAQGWLKINASLIAGAFYTDINLPNNTYTYRVIAVDSIGNESQPSNEASATVNISLPQAPVNLIVTSVPEGGALKTSWDYAGIASGYNLYRSTKSGGPYTKINTAVLTNTSHIDTGLINGTAYYYVVAAVDAIGNESVYSNEAMGVPSDLIPPSSPIIFFPTISGMPVSLNKDRTDISGNAEPGVTVRLFKEGSLVGSTTATGANSVQTFSLGSTIYEASMSPDGKTIAYVNDNGLWLKDLVAGNPILIKQNSYSPLWAPGGEKIAYSFQDNNGYYRIGIYDMTSSTTDALTADTNTNEKNLSWSSDGNKATFTSDRDGTWSVWLKDLTSGTISRITETVEWSNAVLSPDGSKLALLEDIILYSVDISSGNKVQVDPQSNGYDLSWSPDSKYFVYVVEKDSMGDIYLWDVNAQTQTQITNAPEYEYYPSWSPDGQNIVYASAGNTNQSIWISPMKTAGDSILLQQGMSGLNYLAWTKSGGIAYLEQDKLNIAHLKGYFNFKNVSLNPGENIFYAAAVDSSGSSSQSSESISVTFNAPPLPDLEITTEDIFIYPLYPQKSDDVAINITVWNKGQMEAKDTVLEIYLSSQGSFELLKSEKIPSIAPGSGETVSVNWNCDAKQTSYSVMAVADPENKINEFNETNNFAMKEIVVASADVISMTTSLDKEQYSSNQDVKILIDLKNAGIEQDISVVTSVEDSNGTVVDSLNQINSHMPYASHQNFDLLWNTGTVFAGTYKVQSVLKDSAGILAENTVPFTILPDLNVDLTLSADKISYAPRENVSIDIGIRNIGINYIIPQLTTKVKITDVNNNIFFTEERILTNVLPNIKNSLNLIWNTGLIPPAVYNISAETYVNDQIIATKTVPFTINPVVLISGNITVVNPVIFGFAVKVGYTVTNSGNIDLVCLPVKIVVMDPESQTIVDSHEYVIDLPMNGTITGEFIFLTLGNSLKTYAAALQYTYQNNIKNIANTSFTVKDVTAPVVNILSPESGRYYNSKVDMAVTTTDDASGVDKVEYQLDSGTWKLLPVSDLSSGRYSITWTPVKADEGDRIVSFRAIDKAGNISQPVSRGFKVDLTPPPPPVIISPPNDSFVLSDIVDIKGQAEYGSVVEMSFTNTATTSADPITGEFIFNGIKLSETQSIMFFTAKDIAGNISEPTKHTLYMDITKFLTGTITAAPNPVYQGQNEAITYSVTNNSSGNIASLNLEILVIDKDTNEVKQIFKTIADIPSKTTVADNFAFSTSGLAVKTYIATLNVKNTTMPSPLTLASATFEVKPALEATKKVPDITNLLVWINDGCHHHEKHDQCNGWDDKHKDKHDNDKCDSKHDDKDKDNECNGKHNNCDNKDCGDKHNDCHDNKCGNKHNECDDSKCSHHKKCIRQDLLENILKETATSYLIVQDKKDFEKELRNPYYTDIIILGEHHPIEDHYINELKEQIYSGKGIITSLYLKHGWYHDDECSHDQKHDNLFGIKYKGQLSGDNHQIELLNSPISEPDVLDAKGKANKIEANDINTVAAWIEEDNKHNHKKQYQYPAIVLNTYGLGKTIYYAFDLGMTLDETNYTKLKDIIKNSITYIHKPQTQTTFQTNQLIPVEIQVKSLGSAFNLKLIETYPQEIKIYNPLTGNWITNNPWEIEAQLSANETKTMLYYALMPNTIGTYTLKTDIGYIENNTYNLYQALSLDINVNKNNQILTSDIVTALNALAVSHNDKHKIRNAIEQIEKVQKRIIKDKHDIEQNIHDILTAIDSLISIRSADTSNIRIMMDNLLTIWEGKWFWM